MPEDSVGSAQSQTFLRGACQSVPGAIEDRDPSTLDKQVLAKFFASMDNAKQMQDWQFAELINAVRIYLLEYLKSNSATSFDWAYWNHSARTLKADHATTAREFRPEELVRQKIQKSTGCLLYTSPSPRDLSTSRMPSSA